MGPINMPGRPYDEITYCIYLEPDIGTQLPRIKMHVIKRKAAPNTDPATPQLCDL